MEEWSYQQRSDEGLGQGQGKHTPAQKKHTHKYKCTNMQTLKAAGTLHSSCTHIPYTHTHTQVNSALYGSQTAASRVLSCATTA